MFAKTFPLMGRGLRLDARLLRPHMLRGGVVGIVLMFLFFAAVGSLTVGAPGLLFFEQIIWVAWFFSTLAAGTFFATAITEEKEEQTLGLLTLADIRPAALILGKFLPRLVSVLLILSTAFPFTLLAITLGGVTWGQVWAAYWTLFAHIVFMGTVGLLFSVICRQSGWSIAWTIIALIAFFAGPPLLHQLLSAMSTAGVGGRAVAVSEQICQGLVDASAYSRIDAILGTGFAEGAFGVQVVSNLALGAALFVVSWALFGLFNSSSESATERITVLQRGIRLHRGSRRAWRWALVGKDFYDVAGGPTWWGVRALLFIPPVLIYGFASNNFQMDVALCREVGHGAMGLMIYALPLELIIAGARVFRGEIKNGTWPNLVALPLSIAEIGYSKALGSCLGVVPAIAFFFLGMVLAPQSVLDALIGQTESLMGMLAAFVFSLIVVLIFVHLTALYSVLFNAWAGVLLALLTMFIASCFMYPVFVLPAVLIGMMATVTGYEALGIVLGMGLYGCIFLGICFGLQVLIAQRLRIAAGQ
jgi:ABC-type transport system involved in multi-copper enzyme maturation permease subunit